MSWPARTWIAGELVTAALGNAYWRDPLVDLRAGGIAISGQAANDFVYAAGASSLGRLAAASGKVPRYNGVFWELVLPLELAWPVGSIYRAAVSTSPATLFGFGTWVQVGAGRVVVGFDSGDADFNAAEETGGALTHALTVAEMPSHTHVQDSHNHTQNSHNHTQDAHDHDLSTFGSNILVNSTPEHVDVLDNAGTMTTSSDAATNNAATATNNAATATNQSAGSGTAHSNVQPYVVAYVWKRTA